MTGYQRGRLNTRAPGRLEALLIGHRLKFQGIRVNEEKVRGPPEAGIHRGRQIRPAGTYRNFHHYSFRYLLIQKVFPLAGGEEVREVIHAESRLQITRPPAIRGKVYVRIVQSPSLVETIDTELRSKSHLW
jgi:hypothetical protein